MSAPEHEHAFTNLLARIADGDSVDLYSTCSCGWIEHTYTYATGKVFHRYLHPPGSWAAGYANGFAQGLARGRKEGA